MRRLLLLPFLVGCASAPSVAPTTRAPGGDTTSAPEAEERPARVATSDVVLQSPEAEPITALLAAPGWPHFITVAGGVVAVHDTTTGETRAWMRPWPRESLRAYADARGRRVLLVPRSSYETTALLWSLEDDRVTVLEHAVPGGHQEPRISPRGDRLLVTSSAGGRYELRVEDAETRRVLAREEHASWPLAELTRAGDALVVMAAGSGPMAAALVDADTLRTRASLGDALQSVVLLHADRVLLRTSDGIVARSAVTGEVTGRIAESELAGASFAAPSEAYDGRCIAVPVPDTDRVRLYETAHLAFVHEAAPPEIGSFAVLPGCTGILVNTPGGELRTYGPAMPPEGTAFGSFGTFSSSFGAGPRVVPVEMIAPDTAIAVNGVAHARVVRGLVTPSYLVAPSELRRARSPWNVGFVEDGGAFVVGRGFVDRFDAHGYVRNECTGPGEVVRSGARSSLLAAGTVCELDQGRVRGLAVQTLARTGRYALAVDAARMNVVVDLETGETRPVPRAPAGFTRPIGVSESGARIVYLSEDETSVTVVDPARMPRAPSRITLAHPAQRVMLYDGMLVVEGSHITLYDLAGAVKLDRPLDLARYVPVSDARAAFIVSDGTHAEVVDARTARVLATLEGAPPTAARILRPFEPEPRFELPVLDGPTRMFVRVRTDGEVQTVSVTGRVLGADARERFIATCEDGALRVIDGDDESVRALGACSPSDRVAVRNDGLAILLVRGVRIVLRTEHGDTTLHVLERGQTPGFIATRGDGTWTGTERVASFMRYRAPGSLLTAPLRALEAAQESPSIMGMFSLPPAR